MIDAGPRQAAAHQGRARRLAQPRIRRLQPGEHLRGLALRPAVQDPLRDGVARQRRQRKHQRPGRLGLDQPDLVAAPVDLLQPQRDDVAAAQPGRDRERDHRVVPLPAGGPGPDPLQEAAGLLTGEARQHPHPPRGGVREQAADPDVAEAGGVEEREEPLQRPHHVAGPAGPPGRHLGHEPPDVIDRDLVQGTPAGQVEISQEVAGLAGQQPCRSRPHLAGGRGGELLQDPAEALAEAMAGRRAHHLPRRPAGFLELQHHAGHLDQVVPPVRADLAEPRTLPLAGGELLDHAGGQHVEALLAEELHGCLAALAVAACHIVRQAHALNHAEHGISQPGHPRSHDPVSPHAVNHRPDGRRQDPCERRAPEETSSS